MAQMCLLVEGALRHGIEVWVALPLSHRSRGEQRWLDSLEHDSQERLREEQRIDEHVRARRRALRFMRHCGFHSALVPLHVPDVGSLLSIDEDHDPADALAPDPEQATRGSSGTDLRAIAQRSEIGASRRVFALQWMADFPSGDARRQWEQEAVRQLALRGAVFTKSDAEAVVGIVLRELVANVRDHAAEKTGVSCRPAALVGAVAVRSTKTSHVAIGDRIATEEYGQWIHDSRAPVLRLVVGDSGVGICETLDLVRNDNPPESRTGREWTRNERLLFWSLTPFSSRRRTSRDDASVRGLASVRRTVGASSGALVLRCADAIAGYVYPDRQRQSVESPARHLPWTPGTLVDISFAPTAAPRALLSRGTASARVQITGIVQARHSPDQGIDAGRVRAAFPRIVAPGDAIVGVLADPLGDPAARYADGLALLQLAEELSDHAGLVLLALGPPRVRLDRLLREIDDVRIRRSEPASAPIMVLDQTGETNWLGVTDRQFQLLSALTASPSLRLTHDSACALLQCHPFDLAEQLANLSRWIFADESALALRISPTDITEGIRRHVQARVGNGDKATVRRAGIGEALLTPTLAAVERWIDVPKLIGLAGGPTLVGHLLGTEIAPLVRAASVPIATPDDRLVHEDLLVVCIGPVSKELQRAFQAALGTRGRVIQLLGEAGRYDDPGAPFVLARSRFVCLTDAMVTASHVRHAVHDLVRAGAEPVAVATVLDARTDQAAVRALGHELPVAALAHIPLVVDETGRTLLPVPPIHSPEQVRLPPPLPRVPISEEEMLAWCERVPDCLITGHVARVTNRHFTSYLDAQPLLAHSEFRSVLSEHIAATIREWLDQAESRITTLRLMFPGGRSETAGQFAALVSDAWRGHAPPVRGSTAIRTTFYAGRRVMDIPNEDFEQGTGVVICDWGAVTLHSTNDLIHGAAEMAATEILALVLSSQMSSQDEHAAWRLRAVAGRSPDAPDGGPQMEMRPKGRVRVERTVPSRIRFLTRFPVGYEAPGECIRCRYASEYALLANRAPSDVLRQHSDEIARAMEPVDLATAREDRPRDAFGHALVHGEVVSMFSVRQRLRFAREDTDTRRALRDDLRRGEANFIDAVVRLVALEPTWLKLPPLRFDSLRSALADGLERRLSEPDLAQQPVSLRRQYVLVLRAVSKRRFLAQVPTLATEAVRASDGLTVATQVVEGVYSLVRRPYHSGDRELNEIGGSLLRAVERLGSERSLAATPAALRVQEAASTVLAEVDYRQQLAATRELTTRESWLRLRVDYFLPVTKHHLETNIASLEHVVRSRRRRSSDEWRHHLATWRGVQRTLVTTVLPHLRVVRGIVLAYSRHAQPENVERAERACSVDVLRDLATIDALLTEFAAGARQPAVGRDELEQQVSWWHQFVFLDDGGLLECLRDCPCDLVSEIQDAIASTDHSSGRPEKLRPLNLQMGFAGEAEVFCHPFVIRKLVHHFILNARELKHAAPETDESEPVNVYVEVGLEGPMARVRVRNTGTAVTDDPGAGLAQLSELLEAYGGLIGTAEPLGDWSFDISAYIPTWDGVE